MAIRGKSADRRVNDIRGAKVSCGDGARTRGSLGRDRGFAPRPQVNDAHHDTKYVSWNES